MGGWLGGQPLAGEALPRPAQTPGGGAEAVLWRGRRAQACRALHWEQRGALGASSVSAFPAASGARAD